jgi:hypothetical protein
VLWHDAGVAGPSWRSGRALAAAAAAAAVTACTVMACSGGEVERGFGSRQLSNLRDSSFVFNGSFDNLVYYSTGGGSGGTTSYFSIDIVTGQVTSFGSSFPTVMPPTPPPFACAVDIDLMPGSPHFIITDTQSGATTTIDNYYSSSPDCPMTADQPLVVWRWDAGDHLTLWMGPFAALQQVPLALTIDQIVSWGTTSTTVLAATPDTPDAHGLYTIDMTSLAVANVVPAAATSADWAPGATPTGPLASASLDVPKGPTMAMVSFGDHFIYPRAMSDGSVIVFAGPFPSGPTELALFPLPPAGDIQAVSVYPAPLAKGTIWADPAWHVIGTAADTIDYWHDATRELVTCSLPAKSPFLSGMAAPAQARVMFQPYNSLGSTIMSGPLELLSLDPAAPGCTSLATADVTAAAFSPDGGSMFWLSSPPTGDATLWAAAGDGSAPRTIGSGPIYADYPPKFVTDTEIELTLGGDLAWIDLRDDPVRMHYIAEQVWGASIDFGDWLVADYDISGQDGTGNLALINRTSGDKRLISPEVAAFDWVGGYPVTPPIPIVYLVRGHNPSPQDGIWVAAINDTDLH